MRLAHRARGGFTLVELLISLSLLATIMGGLMMVSGSLTKSVRAGTASGALEEAGQVAMRQLATILREASSDTLTPRPAVPFSTTQVDFLRADSWDVHGFNWNPLERIRLDAGAGGGRVLHLTDVDAPGQRTVTLCKNVRPLLEGELPNGVDDNGNGLIDEPGFCLTFEDDFVVVRLTLEDTDADGHILVRTWERQVGFRN